MEVKVVNFMPSMETLFYSFTVDRLSIPGLGAYKMIYTTIQAEYYRHIQYERLTVAIGVEDIMVTVYEGGGG